MTEQLIAMGLIGATWQIRDREIGVVGEFDLALLKDETAHPYRVQCEQYKLTRILLEKLAGFPDVDVEFDARVRSVDQADDHVVVTADTASGPQAYRGAYLIGADGAASAVRRSVDIPFEGFTFLEQFLVLSTPFDFAMHFPRLANINYIADAETWFVLLRVPDFWRALFPVSPEEGEAALLAESAIEAKLQGVVATGEPYEVAHRTLYRIHQRVAAQYRKGRVFLAGDAAHINNPLGGMGMNGGIHDAFSLAEKLAGVLRAEAEPSTLDLYERQRRSIAIEFIQAQTLQNRSLLAEPDPKLRAEKLDEIRAIAADPVRAHAFLMRTSMIASLRKSASLT